MPHNRNIIFALFFLVVCSLNAQNSDSLIHTLPNHHIQLYNDSHSAVYVAAPLLAGSFAMQGMDKSFRAIRNGQMPAFKTWYDNYTQWAPLAVMLGLKVGGVKSRNNWGQLLVSDVMSGAIMAIMVNAGKYTIKRKRPDGTSRNSFPSGHSATAFMTAAFLSKEYGHISPWITVGSYTCATVTGITRVCNNRHWMSDIFAGAGIGILSAELGYYIADKIFKTHTSPLTSNLSPLTSNPSYIALQLSGIVPLTRKISENISLKPGAAVSIDGAYFFSPYIGIGATLTSSSYQISGLGDWEISRLEPPITPQPSPLNPQPSTDQSSTSWSMTGGINLSYPISNRFFIGGKIHAGCNTTLKDEENNLPETTGIIYTAGIRTTYRAYKKLNFSLNCDYNLLPESGSITNSALHSLNIGLAAQIPLLK